MRSSVLFPLVLLLSISAVGQNSLAEIRPFEIPSKHISVLFVSDPNSPIKLSGPISLIGWSNGDLSLNYELQNISDHNVQRFEIKEINWFASIIYSPWGEMKENFLFVPLMTESVGGRNEMPALVPFDETKGGKSFLHPSNRIWIVMVTKVKLSDGTTYNAWKKYVELENFIVKQQKEFESAGISLDQRERTLREFVENLMSRKN